MARTLRHEGGPFRQIHEDRIGEGVRLDDLGLERYPAELVAQARRVWQQRLATEHRSIQIMTRFLAEVVGAGDPLEVYATAVDLVEDEVHHTALCAALCEALGAPATLPDEVALRDPPEYLAAPMPQRALTTAIQMLAINETLSVAFIEDLHDRCANPAVKRVLWATIEDEETHREIGWLYVEKSLARFPTATLPQWRAIADQALAPHRDTAARILAEVPEPEQHLELHPEPELAALGLFSPLRQALAYRRCYEEELHPRLARLGLA